MSALLRASRVASLAARPAAGQGRTMASEVLAKNAHETEHAVKATSTWKTISMYVVSVALAVVTYKCFITIPHPHQTPFVEYPHLRKRAKPFPWGDGNHSLFHNPVFNALPDGYEQEESHH